ncbi:MAG: Mth938-like domain-containing protein [Paracoccaceae bacterium]
MALNEIDYSGPAQPIDGYGPGFFRFGGRVWQGPLLVGPAGAAAWGGMEDLAALKALEGQVDVLLLGTGATLSYADPALMVVMNDLGIGVEPMISPSAARSYNMLLAEGRRVAAALLPV